MSVFDINYDTLVPEEMPVRLRQQVHVAWLKALVSAVDAVYGQFAANRAANVYVLTHNAQVCYLEAALNDTFDPSLRRIYITDADAVDPAPWALDDEDAPEPWALASETAPVPWPLASEVSGSALGFVVNVPAVLVFDMDRMKAVVNFYRLPTSIYSIVTF